MSMPKKLLLLFAIIGLIDSAYLTAVHYTNLPLYCPDRRDCKLRAGHHQLACLPWRAYRSRWAG